MRERWEDRTQAPEARLAAALGWLCLTDEPAPEGLRAVADDLATDERAHAMDDLPWMAAAGGSGETGARRCVRWTGACSSPVSGIVRTARRGLT
jgi:hypothetical protein